MKEPVTCCPYFINTRITSGVDVKSLEGRGPDVLVWTYSLYGDVNIGADFKLDLPLYQPGDLTSLPNVENKLYPV